MNLRKNLKEYSKGDIMKKPLIVITGPTACRKTDTSVELAKLINGEIISADSMQVYKYMDIGTAKATKEEMQGIKHYLVDEIFPDAEYNAMIFQKKAKEYIEEIYAKGKVPIVAGGTGFYINALAFDNDFEENDDDGSIREMLEKEAEEKGADFMYEKLEKVDPEYAQIVHKNNLKRVIRALEYNIQTGNKFSAHNAEGKQKESPYNLGMYVLNMDREKLYERINLRVDKMFEAGLVEEVAEILDMGYTPELVSMQGLGYKEFIPFFEGKCSLEEVSEEIKQKTRHFAKRQLTWFRRQLDGTWVDVTNITAKEAAEIIKKDLTEKGII